MANRGNGKNKSTIASSKKKKESWSASDDLPKADTRAGG